MVYILYVKARFSTAQKRDNALTRVTNYLAQPSIADDLFVSPAAVAPFDAPYKGWDHALSAQCRFRTQASRDDLWNDMDTYLSTANNAPLESYGEKWDQMLDAPNPDADTTRYNQFSKTWA
jgi:hypothetical protein